MILKINGTMSVTVISGVVEVRHNFEDPNNVTLWILHEKPNREFLEETIPMLGDAFLMNNDGKTIHTFHY